MWLFCGEAGQLNSGMLNSQTPQETLNIEKNGENREE